MTTFTSTEAYRTIMPRLNDLQHRVLERFRAIGDYGLTSEELFHYFQGYKETTSRTRISELVRFGLIQDSGRTRPSSAGRRMIVWTYVA